MRRIYKSFGIIIALLLLTAPSYAFSGAFRGAQTKSNIYHQLPKGVTFQADFIEGYTQGEKYCSKGSSTATFTNNAGNTPVFNANGLSITTARDDVLKYVNSGNRTASEETIIVKFVPDSDFAAGTYKFIIDSDTKQRTAYSGAAATINTYPNYTDNAGVNLATTTTPVASTSYVLAMVFGHSSPVVTLYVNGVRESPFVNSDYTTPVWGTYWYLGCANDGSTQANITVSAIAIFNRALTASEVSAVGSLL